jgi:hypothetical protein
MMISKNIYRRDPSLRLRNESSRHPYCPFILCSWPKAYFNGLKSGFMCSPAYAFISEPCVRTCTAVFSLVFVFDATLVPLVPLFQVGKSLCGCVRADN